jgi:hypothetical protein
MTKYGIVLTIAILFLSACAPKTQAFATPQVTVEVGIAPDCPYGYYDASPYGCAPYGYYGPEWFVGGVFIGAGPWFHGPHHFHGHVDNRFHPEHGYKGETPRLGEKAVKSVKVQHFRGNEVRDGRGNVGKAASHSGKH